MILRPYQKDILDQINTSWGEGTQNICGVMPCGAGKTVLFGTIVSNTPGYRFVIAHRQELVSQMSMTIAKMGVKHCILASDPLVKNIIKMQVQEFGEHFSDPKATCFVTGVQTLINRAHFLPVNRAKLWVIDECHHVLRENVWGKALTLFPPSCRGLGVTATPNRADGHGIGRHAEGVFDTMIEGPSMRSLINNDYLTDYRVFGPYSKIDMSKVTMSSRTGDYSKPKLINAIRESKIVGDVIKSYLNFAPGKLGVVFVPDVKTGDDMTTAFNSAGVPARCVHAKTPDAERQQATASLKRGDLKLLINVDIFGEGYDLPAIEVVSFARPTKSLPLYIQQFGRGLRKMEGKDKAIIIDHVRNVEYHRPPDSLRTWNLDSRESKASKRDPNLIPIRTCHECLAVFESWNNACPFCGWEYEPTPCGSIEQVEGDITELDPATLAAMRGEVERINGPPPNLQAGGLAQAGLNAQWRRRQEAQTALKEAMSIWAGYQTAAGQSIKISMRRFYKYFGVDVLSAQALGRKEAEELTIKLIEAIK
jgi:DNA repair protein RadD